MYIPLISVIIPVYNGSNYLSKAIDSVLAQTYKYFEIIVVNDGSNDCGKTEAIARSYSDKIVYVHRSENKGIAYTLNEGIDNMHGDYFAWLSHDDIYLPDKLKKQVAFLNEIFEKYNSCDPQKIMLSGISESINENGEIIGRKPFPKYTPGFRSKRSQLLDNLRDYGLGGCSVLIPKNAFEEVGKFDTKWITLQDANMWYRLILGGYTFFFLPERLVQSRIHPEETGKRMKDTYEEERSLFQEWLTDETKKYPDFQDWKFYFFMGCYQEKYGHNSAAKKSFSYSKEFCGKLGFYLSYISIATFYRTFGFVRNKVRKVYATIISMK